MCTTSLAACRIVVKIGSHEQLPSPHAYTQHLFCEHGMRRRRLPIHLFNDLINCCRHERRNFHLADGESIPLPLRYNRTVEQDSCGGAFAEVLDCEYAKWGIKIIRSSAWNAHKLPVVSASCGLRRS